MVEGWAVVLFVLIVARITGQTMSVLTTALLSALLMPDPVFVIMSTILYLIVMPLKIVRVR